MNIVYWDGRNSHDVTVRASSDRSTIADLAAVLDPAGSAVRGLFVDGHRCEADLELHRSPIRNGSTVGFDRRDVAARNAPVLLVVSGPQSGTAFPLRPGRMTVGRRSGADVPLADTSVSRQHAELFVDARGSISLDLGASTNGGSLNGRSVEGAVPLQPGDMLQLGAVHLRVQDRRDVADFPVPSLPDAGDDGRGTLLFARPPLEKPLPPVRTITLPKAEGPEREKPSINLFTTIAPVGFAGVMVVITKNPMSAGFALLSPTMAVGNWWSARRRHRAKGQGQNVNRKAELAALKSQLLTARDQEAARRDRTWSDLAEVTRRAVTPSRRLWERRPNNEAFLELRVGIADVPWAPPIAGPAGGTPPADVAAVIERWGRLVSSPVGFTARNAVIGVVGEPDRARAAARALLLQAVVHHGPADLPVVLCAAPDAIGSWEWTKWLPHVRVLSETGLTVTSAAEESRKLLDSLLLARREGEPKEQQTLLLILDDESLVEGRQAPAREALNGTTGPVCGIVIAASDRKLPASCTHILSLDGPDGEAVLTDQRTPDGPVNLIADGASIGVARTCAHALARFEDPEVVRRFGELPPLVRLLPLLGFDAVDPPAVLRRWRAGIDPGAGGPIGLRESGPLSVDLVHDGPHGLIVGASGMGKSELLRSLLLSMVVSASTDDLSLLLLDAKGGLAFKGIVALPHCIGLVTDLDAHRAKRTLGCLTAELEHRKKRLFELGADNLGDFRSRGGDGQGPLPRLVVVVDEFDKFRRTLPGFVDELLDAVQQGRALGVHMIFATQHVGAITDKIRDNVPLRIVLRVENAEASKQLLGTGVAAALSEEHKGRAFVRLQGKVFLFQSALSVLPIEQERPQQAVEVLPFSLNPPAPGQADHEEDAPTELDVLVRTITDAFAAGSYAAPRVVAPPVLRGLIELGSLWAAAPRAEAPVVGRFDDPANQAQPLFRWGPRAGNLLLYGMAGSGTTATLQTLALSAATHFSPDDLHVYAMDFGIGELNKIKHLPHVGAVIESHESERQARLVNWLRSEMGRRAQLPSAERDAQPTLLVLLDGYQGFASAWGDAALSPVHQALQLVCAEGPAVGITLIATGDRIASIPRAVVDRVRQRWVFGLPDPRDASTLGLRVKDIPPFTPGRCMVMAGDAPTELQVGWPGEALQDQTLVTSWPAPRRPPQGIDVLPTKVDIADVAPAVQLSTRPWLLPFGLGSKDLGPAGFDIHEGDHFLILGRRRSGRSTALCAIAAVLQGNDADTIAVAPPRSPLSKVHPDPHRPERLVEVLSNLATASRPTFVLVDDAEFVGDPGAVISGMIPGLASSLHIIAATTSDAIRSMAGNHWIKVVLKPQNGLLLNPDPVLDVMNPLGKPAPKSQFVAMCKGRGYLYNGGELGQVIHTVAPSA